MKKVDFNNIKLLILDVDGVLTDGSIIINDDGSESKTFNVYDGQAIKLWQRAGLKTAIISGRTAEATKIRAGQLGIEYVFQGCKEKLPAFEELLTQTQLAAQQAVYLGDDLPDLPLIKKAGLGVAVANAAQEVKEAADFTTKRPGGSGAVREIVEYILKRTGKWQQLMQRYC